MPHNEREVLNRVLNAVPAKWRPEFRLFVQYGEASDAFFAFLERNTEVLAACEEILNADEGMRLIVRSAIEEVVSQPIFVDH